jgi:Na+(H+)/acetate symporter ActP
MKLNMSQMDRMVRIAVAILIAVLYFLGQISGLAATILLVVAGAFILTSFVGYCPIYGIFGLRTNGRK